MKASADVKLADARNKLGNKKIGLCKSVIVDELVRRDIAPDSSA